MNKAGLIKGMEVQLVSFNEDLFNHIIESRNITNPEYIEKVKRALRYNVISFAAFSDMTNIPVPTLSAKTKPDFSDEGELITKLDYTFLFEGFHNRGFKFVVRNDKSEGILWGSKK